MHGKRSMLIISCRNRIFLLQGRMRVLLTSRCPLLLETSTPAILSGSKGLPWHHSPEVSRMRISMTLIETHHHDRQTVQRGPWQQMAIVSRGFRWCCTLITADVIDVALLG